MILHRWHYSSSIKRTSSSVSRKWSFSQHSSEYWTEYTGVKHPFIAYYSWTLGTISMVFKGIRWIFKIFFQFCYIPCIFAMLSKDLYRHSAYKIMVYLSIVDVCGISMRDSIILPEVLSTDSILIHLMKNSRKTGYIFDRVERRPKFYLKKDLVEIFNLKTIPHDFSHELSPLRLLYDARLRLLHKPRYDVCLWIHCDKLRYHLISNLSKIFSDLVLRMCDLLVVDRQPFGGDLLTNADENTVSGVKEESPHTCL